MRCIANNDSQSLVKIPGVGKKTAERLIIEIRDKLSGWDQNQSVELHGSKPDKSPRNQIVQDAISALIALGYKPQEASRAVSKSDDGEASSEAIIRKALREM